MRITQIVMAALLASAVSMSSAEEQDKQEIDTDEVVAKCEDQFSPEKYTNENERNRMIDECVDKVLGTDAPKSEEG